MAKFAVGLHGNMATFAVGLHGNILILEKTIIAVIKSLICTELIFLISIIQWGYTVTIFQHQNGKK